MCYKLNNVVLTWMFNNWSWKVSVYEQKNLIQYFNQLNCSVYFCITSNQLPFSVFKLNFVFHHVISFDSQKPAKSFQIKFKFAESLPRHWNYMSFIINIISNHVKHNQTAGMRLIDGFYSCGLRNWTRNLPHSLNFFSDSRNFWLISPKNWVRNEVPEKSPA